MFSHVVIFWTDPANLKAADELIGGARKYLAPIPGISHFHVGRMAPSQRPVVDQSYQVALNVVFTSRRAQERLSGASTAPGVRGEGVQADLQKGCGL